MSRASPRITLLVLAAVAASALVPSSLGHEGDDHGEGEDTGDGGFYVPPPSEGRAPGYADRVPYYSYYGSSFLYGPHTVAQIPGQYVLDLAGHGDWLTWTDAIRRDIYAYNLAAGDGFYLTEDQAVQGKPDVHSNVVVWEDKSNGPLNVMAYFLDTGETRRLSRGGDSSTSHENPSVFGEWVAWQDDRGQDIAVYAYNLRTNQEILVSGDERVRNQDPVVIGDLVVYRTLRFNVWDLMWFDLTTGESGTVTADRAMEQAPMRAGDSLLFLKETKKGWELYRFDPESRLTQATGVFLSSPIPPAADGDLMVQISTSGPRASFLARNLTNNAATRITGFLPMQDLPILLGRTLHVPVFNETGSAILSLEINPFAFLKEPRLSIATPMDGDFVKGGRVTVTGDLTYESTWGEPDAFLYSVNGQNWSAVFPSPKWSFTLDLSDQPPGAYEISVEAYYKDAPAIVRTVEVIVPIASSGTDIEAVANAWHAARIQSLYYLWVGSNPAIVALALAGFVLLGLWIAKRRLTVGVVRSGMVEYVPPPDE